LHKFSLLWPNTYWIPARNLLSQPVQIEQGRELYGWPGEESSRNAFTSKQLQGAGGFTLSRAGHPIMKSLTQRKEAPKEKQGWV